MDSIGDKALREKKSDWMHPSLIQWPLQLIAVAIRNAPTVLRVMKLNCLGFCKPMK